MSGDPTNARLWANADVYVSFDLDAADPANIDTAFGVDWDLVGLLDGESGFTHSRNEDTTDHYAWGDILMATSRRNFKYQIGFGAFEDNETTRALVWPGSADGEIVIPRPVRCKIAFEVVAGGVKRRLISAYQAEVDVDGDRVENEQDIAKTMFMATIFPTSAGVLFVEQTTAGLSV